MTTTKITKQLTNIINDLSAPTDKKVFTALKQLRKHGKREAIVPLLNLLNTTTNEEIKTDIHGILFDLKDPSVVEEIIQKIDSNTYPDLNPILVSIFWQSSLDGTENISTFIKAAIRGDYFVGIEVLSVIDNFDATFQEIEIEDLKFDLDEAIEIETTEKRDLLISIRSAMDSLNLEF